MAQPKHRIPELDIARALAVLAIIVYHTGMIFSSAAYPGAGAPGRFVSFLDTFHLYTLFIVSGYLTRFDAPLTGRGVAKAARTLLLPYVVCCLFIMVGATAWSWRAGDPNATAQLTRWGEAALWGAGAQHPLALVQVERIGGIWFLPALFWAKLFIGAIARLKPAPKTTVIVGGFALAVWSANVVWLPLSIQSGLAAAAFMYVGWLMREHAEQLQRIRIPLTLVSLACWAAAAVWGGNSSIAMCAFPAGPIDVLGGIGATWCLLRLGVVLAAHVKPVASLLELVGRNTLPLFALHIVEDNTLPWWRLIQILLETCGAHPWTWIMLVACRLAIEAILVGLVFLVPFLRRVFFPHSRTTLRGAISRAARALDTASQVTCEG